MNLETTSNLTQTHFIVILTLQSCLPLIYNPSADPAQTQRNPSADYKISQVPDKQRQHETILKIEFLPAHSQRSTGTIDCCLFFHTCELEKLSAVIPLPNGS